MLASTAELLTSLHEFSKGPKESHVSILATNIFLFLSLTICISSMISFMILKKKNQLNVLQTLVIFREIGIFHQGVLFFLVLLQMVQLVYLLSPNAPHIVFLLQDITFTVLSGYLTILSSMMSVLIFFYSVNLVYEIPKLLEIGSIVLKREHIFRMLMLAYGLWFSVWNHRDTTTYRSNYGGIIFSFNPFDSILIFISTIFIGRYLLVVYRTQYQRLLGNRVFLLISILVMIKLFSMMINLIGVLALASVKQEPPTFFEVVRMTEGLIQGAAYVNFKAVWIMCRK